MNGRDFSLLKEKPGPWPFPRSLLCGENRGKAWGVVSGREFREGNVGLFCN